MTNYLVVFVTISALTLSQHVNVLLAKPTSCGCGPSSGFNPLLSLPSIPSLPTLNLNLGGGGDSCGPCGSSSIAPLPQISQPSYYTPPSSPCCAPPPPPPCPAPISVIPVPQPVPFPIPQPPPPSSSVTIPNIIVALLPPNEKPAKKPCGSTYVQPSLPVSSYPPVSPCRSPPIRVPVPQPYPVPVCDTGCSTGCNSGC